MRLIDADELKERITIDLDLVEVCDGVMVPCIDFEYNIDFAPTVEAIPIDWINDYIFHMSNIFGPMDISTMVRKYKEGFKPSVPEKGPIK